MWRSRTFFSSSLLPISLLRESTGTWQKCKYLDWECDKVINSMFELSGQCSLIHHPVHSSDWWEKKEKRLPAGWQNLVAVTGICNPFKPTWLNLSDNNRHNLKRTFQHLKFKWLHSPLYTFTRDDVKGQFSTFRKVQPQPTNSAFKECEEKLDTGQTTLWLAVLLPYFSARKDCSCLTMAADNRIPTLDIGTAEMVEVRL